jgi:hypothetical protein
MEIRASLMGPVRSFSHLQLDAAARAAPISTFGWPIAAYLANRDDFRPRPIADGLVAEIAVGHRDTYDYWSLRRNGDFYFLGSLLRTIEIRRRSTSTQESFA